MLPLCHCFHTFPCSSTGFPMGCSPVPKNPLLQHEFSKGFHSFRKYWSALVWLLHSLQWIPAWWSTMNHLLLWLWCSLYCFPLFLFPTCLSITFCPLKCIFTEMTLALLMGSAVSCGGHTTELVGTRWNHLCPAWGNPWSLPTEDSPAALPPICNTEAKWNRKKKKKLKPNLQIYHLHSNTPSIIWIQQWVCPKDIMRTEFNQLGCHSHTAQKSSFHVLINGDERSSDLP